MLNYLIIETKLEKRNIREGREPQQDYKGNLKGRAM